MLRLAIVAASVALLLSGKQLLAEFDDASGTDSWTKGLSWLPLHLGTYLAFLAVTQRIFDDGVTNSGLVWPWIAAWLSLGLVSVASLAATVLSPSRWTRLVPVALKSTLAGCAAGLAAVGVGQITTQFWLPLARVTLDSVHALLSLFESGIEFEPSDYIVGTSAFSVCIAPECSGYEGIGLILVVASVYLLAFRHSLRFPHALLILPIGAVAIWLANVVRITALIEVGTRVSSEIAREGFHSQAGWIAFNLVGLGLVLLVRNTRAFQAGTDLGGVVVDDRSASDAVAERSVVSAEAMYLTPLIAIFSATMFTAALSTGGLDRLYPIRLIAVTIPFWLFRKQYRSLDWSVSWPSLAIGVAVYVLWIARSFVSGSAGALASTGLEQLPPAWAGLWIAARMIGSIATVPVAEELAFRGYLTRRLISADVDSVPAGRFTWLSFIGTSVAFGLLHQHWPEGIAAGMLYAIAYYRRGSIGDAVVAHATTNAILSAQAVVYGDWSIIS